MPQYLNCFSSKYQLALEAARERKLKNGLCGSICKPESFFALDQ